MEENAIGGFEAVASNCGFSVADGANKVKKVLEFVDQLKCNEDEFRFLIFALREVEIERRIEKKIEEVVNGEFNNSNRGGACGKADEGIR